MGKTKVAVVGASGYAGEELMRLLWAHPKVVLVAVTSRQYSGETVADIFPRSSHDETARALKSAPELDVHIDLHSGRGEFVLYASDLTENYVAFNKGGVNDPTTLGG